MFFCWNLLRCWTNWKWNNEFYLTPPTRERFVIIWSITTSLFIRCCRHSFRSNRSTHRNIWTSVGHRRVHSLEAVELLLLCFCVDSSLLLIVVFISSDNDVSSSWLMIMLLPIVRLLHSSSSSSSVCHNCRPSLVDRLTRWSRISWSFDMHTTVNGGTHVCSCRCRYCNRRRTVIDDWIVIAHRNRIDFNIVENSSESRRTSTILLRIQCLDDTFDREYTTLLIEWRDDWWKFELERVDTRTSNRMPSDGLFITPLLSSDEDGVTTTLIVQESGHALVSKRRQLLTTGVMKTMTRYVCTLLCVVRSNRIT